MDLMKNKVKLSFFIVDIENKKDDPRREKYLPEGIEKFVATGRNFHKSTVRD